MSKSDADILAESREYLEEFDWCQGAIEHDHAVCAMGAVAFSQNWVEKFDYSFRVKREALCDLARISEKVLLSLGIIPRGLNAPALLASWNDHTARGKQDVLDAFMKAEKTERSGNVD